LAKNIFLKYLILKEFIAEFVVRLRSKMATG